MPHFVLNPDLRHIYIDIIAVVAGEGGRGREDMSGRAARPPEEQALQANSKKYIQLLRLASFGVSVGL